MESPHSLPDPKVQAGGSASGILALSFFLHFTPMPLSFFALAPTISHPILAVAGQTFPVWFTAVYVVGFIAAVAIGSLAWYNSKRPAGWEDAERPDYVPEVENPDQERSTESGE